MLSTWVLAARVHRRHTLKCDEPLAEARRVIKALVFSGLSRSERPATNCVSLMLRRSWPSDAVVRAPHAADLTGPYQRAAQSTSVPGRSRSYRPNRRAARRTRRRTASTGRAGRALGAAPERAASYPLRLRHAAARSSSATSLKALPAARLLGLCRVRRPADSRCGRSREYAPAVVRQPGGSPPQQPAGPARKDTDAQLRGRHGIRRPALHRAGQWRDGSRVHLLKAPLQPRRDRRQGWQPVGVSEPMPRAPDARLAPSPRSA